MCQISRLLLWKSPQECQNVIIEFCFTMRIFYEVRYTVIIEIVWTFYLKSVPAEFQKYFKLISWVISGTSSSKLSCNPRHPSRNISCNHRHHLLQPSWRRIFSTSNNQKTGVDSDINTDYKASSFDKLYIWRRKWDTAGFVRAHQRKYWNALTVDRGHADDGCSCNHRAVPPSALTPPCGTTPIIRVSVSNKINFTLTLKLHKIVFDIISVYTGRSVNIFATLEVWEWISNFIPQFVMAVITYPCLE